MIENFDQNIETWKTFNDYDHRPGAILNIQSI